MPAAAHDHVTGILETNELRRLAEFHRDIDFATVHGHLHCATRVDPRLGSRFGGAGTWGKRCCSSHFAVELPASDASDVRSRGRCRSVDGGFGLRSLSL